MTATLLCDRPPVRLDGDELTIEFDRFGLEEYALFLKAKALPEADVVCDRDRLTYAVRTPARYAPLLGVPLPAPERPDLPLAAYLYDDQAAIVRLALDAKRFACWSDCGLGKTPVGLEVARHVIHRTGGRVLVVTLNEIVPQWVDEAAKFYGDALPVRVLKSRAELRQWCLAGPGSLAVTNYEKFNPEKGPDGQVVREVKHLAGFIADESSRLKTSGGRQKWAVIKSSKGVPYKLALTATPAPNDFMEFASQAAFLETVRDQAEVIWTYFTRDPKTHRWTVKPHAREAFFRFLAGWSIYVNDPKRYGWRRGLPDVPPPDVRVIPVGPTPEQRAAATAILGLDAGADLAGETNTIQRSKLSQVAKGFRYRKGESGAFDRIPAFKPDVVADLVRQETARGAQSLVWTVFDAESTILAEELTRRGVPFELLTGKTPQGRRAGVLDRFRKGRVPNLVTRAALVGFGMNFQFCTAEVFSGWTDSYEAFYQALRRAVRHGQTERVRVYLPIVRELEGDTWDNLVRKQGRHEEAVAEMEQNFIRSRRELGL